MNDCELKNTSINRFWEAISFVMVYLFQKHKNKIDNKENVEIKQFGNL